MHRCNAALKIAQQATPVPPRVIAVLGGTGHVGSYLVPQLVDFDKAEVVCISRGSAEPYPAAWTGDGVDPRWAKVKRVSLDRSANGFAAAVAALNPCVVIDMICFTVQQCRELVEALAENRAPPELLIHCGSIWAYGPSVSVPTTEDGPHAEPLGDYGRGKRGIEWYLLRELAPPPFPRVVFHPGHIVGRGWAPLNPAGHFDPAVFASLRDGTPVALPNLGMESVHHVHADDIASAFLVAIAAPAKADGQAFSVVSPQALTLRGFARAIADATWPGGGGAAPRLDFLPCPSPEFEARVGAGSAALSLEHARHSPCCSVDKLRRVLGVAPRWSSVEAVADAVRWLDQAGVLRTISFPGKE